MQYQLAGHFVNAITIKKTEIKIITSVYTLNKIKKLQYVFTNIKTTILLLYKIIILNININYYKNKHAINKPITNNIKHIHNRKILLQ